MIRLCPSGGAAPFPGAPVPVLPAALRPGAPAVTAGKRRLCGCALSRLAALRAGLRAGNIWLAVPIAGRCRGIYMRISAVLPRRLSGETRLFGAQQAAARACAPGAVGQALYSALCPLCGRAGRALYIFPAVKQVWAGRARAGLCRKGSIGALRFNLAGEPVASRCKKLPCLRQPCPSGVKRLICA